jgi:hypothetical protein
MAYTKQTKVPRKEKQLPERGVSSSPQATLSVALLGMLALLLVSCGGGGGSGGTPDETKTTTTTEFWWGPARLQLCDDNVGMEALFPSITFTDSRAFVATKATFVRTKKFDSAGVLASESLDLKAVSYDGHTFFDLTDSNPDNDDFAPTGTVVDNPPASGNLMHFAFGNVPKITVEPPVTLGNYLDVPVIEGGGLVLGDSDGDGEGDHAFLFIHDLFGCDLVIAAIQRAKLGETGDGPLPAYDLTNIQSSSWSGFSEEFRDDSPLEDSVRHPGQNLADFFPPDLVWIDEPNWQFDLDNSAQVTGGQGSTFGIQREMVTLSGGSIVLEDAHGYFTGSLTSDFGAWEIRGLMTPDKAYFGGFAWREPWIDQWHDLSLIRQ